MLTDADTLGRMAIRLGRAYSQSWAKEIPKSVPWTWDMAKYYMSISKSERVPEMDELKVEIVYDHSSTHWLLCQERVEVQFYDRKAQAYVGFVRLDVDALGSPVITVRVESPSVIADGQLWRFDKAVTSLSCGSWQQLYSLPPLSVLLAIVGKGPSCPITLYYRVGTDGPTIDVAGAPVGEAQRVEYAAFDRAVQRFKERGGCSKWERAVVK